MSSKDVEDLFLQLENLKSNLNQEFRLFISLWIVFMQCGFAFLEAGAVRSKNTTNILFKNFLDLFVGALAYWIFGYAFAFGIPGNGFIGHNFFLGTGVDHREYQLANATAAQDLLRSPDVLLAESYYSTWISQFAFAATSSTIVSGAMAERTQFVAYLIYSFVITGYVYPLVSHWCWSDIGFLKTGAGTGITFIDFAGSGVVHITGGTAAFIGAAMLQPRIGRYGRSSGSNGGSLVDKDIRGHSVPLVSLGAFILFTGFIAFNAGSQQSITERNDGITLSIAATSTILAGSTGAVSALVFNVVYHHCRKEDVYLSVLTVINGGLVGMVSSCAGSNQIYPWCAVLLGAISGPLMVITENALIRRRIDDPIGAVAVHLTGGIVGVILAPFFVIKGQISSLTDEYVGGIFYTSDPSLAWSSFGWNLLGATCIIAWTASNCAILFATLKLVGLLRITPDEEMDGLDIIKHGEPAYPEAHARLPSRREFTSV